MYDFLHDNLRCAYSNGVSGPITNVESYTLINIINAIDLPYLSITSVNEYKMKKIISGLSKQSKL